MKIFDVKRRKKGSLELSINSIVIVILAIVMLGLGMTFMRGLFKQIKTKVSEAVDANELTNPPTADNPLTVAPAEISLRQTENGKVILAFLNVITSRPTSYCKLVTVASSTGATDPAVVFSLQELLMEKDQINTWTVALTSTETTPVGVNLYTAKIDCAATAGGAATQSFTKDFSVSVTT